MASLGWKGLRVLKKKSGAKEQEVTGGWRNMHNEEIHGLCS
jgi:hypothetical protein